MDYLIFSFGGGYQPRFEMLGDLAHDDNLFYQSDAVSKFALEFNDDYYGDLEKHQPIRIIKDDIPTWYDTWTDQLKSTPKVLTWWGNGGGPLLIGCSFIVLVSFLGGKWLLAEVKEKREKRRREEWEIEKMIIDENSPLL